MDLVAERYLAEYGNLRLEVRLLSRADEQAFEFRVLDKNNGGVNWVGERPDLSSAQDSALFEAQTFLETPARAPTWSRERIDS